MKSMRVFSVISKPEEGSIHAFKEITNDDGSLDYIFHIMPSDIFEWRAAEYGIDDLDELIDIVLHEPYVDSLPSITDSTEDAKTKIRSSVANLKSKLNGKPKHTLNEAKQTMSQRGMDKKYLDGATTDPITDIKAVCDFDDVVISAKKNHVATARKDFKQLTSGTTPKFNSAQRAAKVRMTPNSIVDSKKVVLPIEEVERHRTVFLGG